MVYRAYIPRPPLSELVELFWYYEGHNPRHEKERRLPDGSMQLVVNLREDRLRVCDGRDHDRFRSFGGCLLSGVHSGFVVIDTANQERVMGVHFKPGGVFPFFGLPARELRNTHAPLEALWGVKAGELRSRLLGAGTLEAKFCALEHALLERATRPLDRHPAVAFALKEFRRMPQARKISDVIERIGLSHRRFVQLFDEEVGLTPKVFCRIRRFQEALRLCRGEERIGFGELALACGYFDQAHFVRDFREFSGLTPTAYLARRGEHRNHVPISD
jgi:AraC-like DNA-binding protein